MKPSIMFFSFFISLPVLADEVPLNVPSDSSAQYFVLEKGGNSYVARTITTRRVGTSGTSYSKRLYNCEEKTVKYLGTGDSVPAMNASFADKKMSPISEKSIAYYVGLEACKL